MRPADAWQVTDQEEAPDEIEVDLQRGPEEYEIEIELEGGVLEIEVDYEIEGPFPG